MSKIKSTDRQRRKEIRGRKSQLNKIEFPKLQKVSLSTKLESNIDYERNIEPGFMTTVAFGNFTKIFATRNITAPFMRVFMWTVLWSFFLY